MRAHLIVRGVVALLLAGLLLPVIGEEEAHAPIPLRFTLKEPSYVTLVIEDQQGHRLRNLIGETLFPAGENVAWWDGLDDRGIARDAAQKHTYRVQGQFVEPGTYRVRGLYRKAIDLKYEFSVNSPGTPPWRTEDRTGGWLADHTPQTDVLYLPQGSPYGTQPQLLLSSSIAEAGDSLLWADLDGKRRYGGTTAGWRGAHALARDPGAQARAEIHAYAYFCYKGLQLYGIDKDGNSLLILTVPLTGEEYTNNGTANALSVAVYNGTAVINAPLENTLLFVDTHALQPKNRNQACGKVIATVEMPQPRGLLADAAGRLYVLTEKHLRRYQVDWTTGTLREGTTLVAAGLEDPHKLALDGQGNLYISDWGASQQVKVYSPAGQFLRAIGTPGGPRVGRYDQTRMSHPNGLAVTPDGRLWVAESTYMPKRMSVWKTDGTFLTAFYGPPAYGGGGTLDPQDKTRFYYGRANGAMEFVLDWERGTASLRSLVWLPNGKDFTNREDKPFGPESPISVDGRRYLTNCFQDTGGSPPVLVIWQLRDEVAVPAAAVGVLNLCRSLQTLLHADEAAFIARMPEGFAIERRETPNKTIVYSYTMPAKDAKGAVKPKRVDVLFAWCDLNGDGQVQTAEVALQLGETADFTVHRGLDILTSTGWRIPCQGFTAAGAPRYDLGKMMRLLREGAPDLRYAYPGASHQVLLDADGRVVVTGAPMVGFRNGEPDWYYHSQWPTGFSKTLAPKPEYPGQLLDTMRLLGPAVTPRAGEAGGVWAILGDWGNVFLLTTDGLFVATLFKDQRIAATPYWPAPASRGMRLNDVTLLGECYSPTMTQVADGAIYLQAGKARSSLIRVEGLESIRRFPAWEVTVTRAHLAQAKTYLDGQTAERQQAEAPKELTVALRTTAPVVDGNLDDWKQAEWVPIEQLKKRILAEAAVCVAGDRLYVAYRLSYDFGLQNKPDALESLFKGGDALDLLLGSDPAAQADRTVPAPGDLRLLVTRVDRKPKAVLFAAVVPGTKEPVKYESPVGSVAIDKVEDVTAQVVLAGTKANVPSGKKLPSGQPILETHYYYEFSIPLAALHLAPQAGQTLRGDLGLLRGKPGVTSDRLYWSNKFAGQVNDLPSEARLTPHLWGTWRFVQGK